ncbi:DUF5667 domain-containing protein [Nonomuraea sp. NBC_01738]|uniref:DUF5667 domain-containing protein n=1 Tax=Nonomuraea sp. NBC_01738 TaxID=2976003 RepID=UPI002E15F6D9|nr:DUF5667 domain-containing protein [Nonomuraea sp. NBC_01738]
MGRARPRRWALGGARRSRERTLTRLGEIGQSPLGGGPDAGFRERLRDQLLSARESEQPEVRPSRPAARHARRSARRLSWPSQLATLALAGGMMVSAFATYRAVPGDTLYPLKRAAESTLVRLSTDDVERAEREMTSAKERAAEVAALLDASSDSPLVTATLSDMEESTRSAIKRLQRAEPRSPKLGNFAQEQRDMVKPMLEQLNGPQQDQANTYLTYIEGLAVPG